VVFFFFFVGGGGGGGGGWWCFFFLGGGVGGFVGGGVGGGGGGTTIFFFFFLFTLEILMEPKSTLVVRMGGVSPSPLFLLVAQVKRRLSLLFFPPISTVCRRRTFLVREERRMLSPPSPFLIIDRCRRGGLFPFSPYLLRWWLERESLFFPLRAEQKSLFFPGFHPKTNVLNVRPLLLSPPPFLARENATSAPVSFPQKTEQRAAETSVSGARRGRYKTPYLSHPLPLSFPFGIKSNRRSSFPQGSSPSQIVFLFSTI